MNKFILIANFTMLSLTAATGQNLLFQYGGSNQKLITAVVETNKILNDPAFYAAIDSIKAFDNTTFSGAAITAEMKTTGRVEVTEYYRRRTRTNAVTLTKIRMNTAKLNRSTKSIVNTLIHEMIHAVDWRKNNRWNYTHRTQYEERPPISAPYVIAKLSERFL